LHFISWLALANKSFSVFSAQKDPELNFSIMPLTPENFDEAMELLATAYKNRDPMVVHLDVPYDHIKIAQSAYSKRAMEENTAVVVKEGRGNKIVGVGIVIDMFSIMQNPVDYSEILPSDSKIYDMLAAEEAVQYSKEINPTKPLDIIHGLWVAVDENYSGNKIQYYVNKCICETHPVMSKARVFYTEVYNAISAKVCEANGFKVV